MKKTKKEKKKVVYSHVSQIKKTTDYGEFENGMTRSELQGYLSYIALKLLSLYLDNKKIKLHSLEIDPDYLLEQFYKIMGEGNTSSGIQVKDIVNNKIENKSISVIYHCDVERFANKLFFGTGTYFD
jgi:hypothetical protein